MDKLEVMDLQKDYEGTPLLRGVSFTVSSGEILCLLGSSGSGKSTILRIVAGIEKPDGGMILWNSRDISSIPVHQRNFGLMFQDYALFPHLNVAQNVAFGLKMKRMTAIEIDRLVNGALRMVNMAGFENRRVTDLSGGEQQRIALARAFAPNPGLLMLDEPLAALDRSLRIELQEELRDLLHKTGIPAIYVTHDQEEAIIVSDKLALLHNGQIVQCDRTDAVFNAPVSSWAAEFLGMTNFIHGRVVSADPFKVQTPCGEITVQKPVWMGSTPIGKEVSLLIKHTGIIFELKPTSLIALPVEVKDLSFRGDHYRMKVQVCSGELMFFNVTVPYPVGENVYLELSPQDVVCLKD